LFLSQSTISNTYTQLYIHFVSGEYLDILKHYAIGYDEKYIFHDLSVAKGSLYEAIAHWAGVFYKGVDPPAGGSFMLNIYP
jgi:hypothetical protein